jgi:hypothetical protein
MCCDAIRGRIPSPEFMAEFSARKEEEERLLAEMGGPPPCPDWCDGNHRPLNPFERDIEDPYTIHSGTLSDFPPDPELEDEGGQVLITCRESLLDGLEVPTVALVFESYSLTPADARRVAGALLDAADRLEAAGVTAAGL